jgi:hypothetical protein
MAATNRAVFTGTKAQILTQLLQPQRWAAAAKLVQRWAAAAKPPSPPVPAKEVK